MTRHHVRQPLDRARDRHARGIGGRLADQQRNLFVAVAQFEACDHGFPIGRVEGRERRLVAIDGLRADRPFEWQAKARDDGAAPFNYCSPLIDNMRSDPRHLTQMRAMGWLSWDTDGSDD